MHIYFVNRHSKLDGPFDITDMHHQKIIRYGDVIIRETNKGLSFLIVTSLINKWNRCKCVDTVKGIHNFDGNALLFSFNGISKRYGHIKFLDELKTLFDRPPCCDFFNNAIAILTYKCDLWDMSILNNIYTLTNPEVSSSHIKKSTSILHNNCYSYLFEEYLDLNSLNLFHNLINKKLPLRNIYIQIKEIFPKEFRTALLSFINDHPDSTIYDKVK